MLGGCRIKVLITGVAMCNPYFIRRHPKGSPLDFGLEGCCDVPKAVKMYPRRQFEYLGVVM